MRDISRGLGALSDHRNTKINGRGKRSFALSAMSPALSYHSSFNARVKDILILHNSEQTIEDHIVIDTIPMKCVFYTLARSHIVIILPLRDCKNLVSKILNQKKG